MQVNDCNTTALIAAAKNSYHTIVQLLVEKSDATPAFINDGCFNALTIAAFEGHLDTVKILSPR